MHIFYCAGGKIGEVVGVFLAEEHSPDAGSEAPDAVSERPVCRLPDSVRVRHRTIGTGRSLERPVVCVRCEEVLQTSLRMSSVSTGHSGCVRWLASGDPASLWSSLRMSPVCTGRVRCQPAQRPVLCRLPLDSDTRLTLEHRTQVLSVRCPFKSVR